MKKNRVFPLLFPAAAIVLLFAVFFLEIRAIGELKANYKTLAAQEISEEEISLISYDDGLLAALAYGTTDTLSTMASFPERSLRNIMVRTLSVGIVYTAELTVPPVTELLYFAKSFLWILLPALIGKKRETVK